MVTIVVRMDDLEHLVGKPLPHSGEQLDELLYSVKCELSGSTRTETITGESDLQLENKDTNRPDTWSTEGIARALRGTLEVEVGLKKYHVAKKPAVEIEVDDELKEIRPYIACTVAHHPTINDVIIRGLIHLQDKLDQSYGRKRRRSSIGLYDYDLITQPLRYAAAKPDEIKFVPLDGTGPQSLRQILETHPKGVEYGHILREHAKVPILLDSKGNVLSFPPIINSNDLGRVTPETKNILIEVTGTTEETTCNVLTILTAALADRGAEISPAIIHYPYGGRLRNVTTLEMRTSQINLSLKDINSLMGLELSRTQVISLLRRARYDANGLNGNVDTVKVEVPPYRLDILHPVDVIEDIAIAYSLNEMKPKWPSDVTVGNLSPIEEFSNTARELLIGLGFQEVLTFMMSNPDKIIGKMNVENTPIVEIANPKITTLTCIRCWLLPNLMDFLSNNTHVEYPQRLYEVGDCTVWDDHHPNRIKDVRKMACASAHAHANFTEMKSYLEPLMLNLGFEFTLKPADHKSFLEGRCGSILIGDIDVGIVGEIHPQVIENWKLEDPIAAMEVDLGELLKIHEDQHNAGTAPKPPTSERAN